MGNLSVSQKIAALAKLGSYIKTFDDRLRAHMHRAMHTNPWFTIENQELALNAIANNFLDEHLLKSWVESYHLGEHQMCNVGVIMAGNIPLVGFHDVLSVFMSDNVAQIKISERDPYLLPFLLKLLGEIDPLTKDYFDIIDKLSGFDAVIATGSNNSARYFEQYFSKYPNIIRKNRNGVGVLTGEETHEELKAFGRDVFQYFGLGCRNVSHLFVPEDYNFESLNEAFNEHSDIMNHSKYRNNFDHNLAIFILNRFPYVNNGSVLLVEDERLISPIGCLYFSRYNSADQLELELISRQNEIQCVVSNIDFEKIEAVKIGEAQSPSLVDYADGVDTMRFLTSI